MSSQHYALKDNALIVERSFAERVFREIGCTNVSLWGLDILAKRIRRLPMVAGAVGCSPEGIEFARFVDTSKPHGVIIVNDLPALEPLVDALEKKMGNKGKKTRKRKAKNSRKRGELFSFEACGIPEGSTLRLKKDPSITCIVVGDPWKVDFGDDDDQTSFTSRTRKLLGVKDSTYLSPMHYWTYNGKLLRNYYKEIQRGGGKAKKEAKVTEEPEQTGEAEVGGPEVEEVRHPGSEG